MSLTKVSYAMTNGSPVNVLDFGAVGDGVTDDTAAIQAAITAASSLNKTVFFPNGQYLISSTISIPNNISLFGEAERNINVSGNFYGVTIKTNSNITMMQTSAVLPSMTNGISIENISFYGNGSTGTALIIGVDNASSISFGITLRNISVQAVQNGIKLCNPGPLSILENINLVGVDAVNSWGIWFRRGQIAECRSIKIENYAICYYLQWCQDISFYESTASFNVSGITNGLNLVQIYGGYHNTFHSCTFENLSNSSGSVVEVSIFEYFSDPAKSTNNRFYNCAWNGIGTSACRIKIGSSLGPSTGKTFFENCVFRSWGTVTTDVNFENSNGAIFIQCYKITGYDGSDSTTFTYTGTDSALQKYDINGITFTQGSTSFTPALSGGGSGTGLTYSAQIGSAYKIDKTVTLNIRLVLSAKGSATGGCAITGLPYTAAGTASDRIPVTIVGSSLNAGITAGIMGMIVGASTQINLYKVSAGNALALQDTDLTNVSEFYITATYITTA